MAQLPDTWPELEPVVAQYAGAGTLFYGDSSVGCTFLAVQLHDGRIGAKCKLLSSPDLLQLSPASIKSLEGHTDDGVHVRLSGIGLMISSDAIPMPPSNPKEVTMVLSFRQIEVRFHKRRTRHITYWLTNLRLDTQNLSGRDLVVIVPRNGENFLLRLAPFERYSEARSMQQLTRRPAVLTCATLDLVGVGGLESADELMDEICWVLSVARGCKVEWIVRESKNCLGQAVVRHHEARITGDFDNLGLLPAWHKGEVQAFLDNALPAFRQNREMYQLTQGVIDSYLAGRSLAAFTEQKALLSIVVIERLCSLHHARDAGRFATILDNKRFKKVAKSVRDAIRRELNTNPTDEVEERDLRSTIDQMTEKVGELNRRSFKRMLRGFLNDINNPVVADELDLFISSRNALVHQGRFLCSVADKSNDNASQFRSTVDEYLFICNFLDRTVLSLLDHAGAYVDHRALSETGSTIRRVKDSHWPHPLLAG